MDQQQPEHRCPLCRTLAQLRAWHTRRRAAVQQIAALAQPRPYHDRLPEHRRARGLWPDFKPGSPEWYARRNNRGTAQFLGERP